jgi:PfaD family protein
VTAEVSAPVRGGTWIPGEIPAAFDGQGVSELAARIREPLFLVEDGPRIGVASGGGIGSGDGLRVAGLLPPLYPEWLGDRSFCQAHGVRFPYVAGEMAGGIATTAMVITVAKAGMLSFFGAGGLPAVRVRQAVRELAQALPGQPGWGVNLLHSPAEPDAETALADLLLEAGVQTVSASAFMRLTPTVVRLAARGLARDGQGRIQRKTRLFAKVSRPEVAAQFMAPAPAELLRDLVAAGQLTAGEAGLAALVPVAEDVTVEADSGGHTDNRPLTVLLPLILGLRDELTAQHGYASLPGYGGRIRVGAAGGLGTPAALAAAFAMGAAYVLTGSVNQACVEAGTSRQAKAMLAGAGMADVMMAPAADMFELGVRVQVLKRGTMFPLRAGLLYEVYDEHDSWNDVPAPLRARIERELFRMSFVEAWASTRSFWTERDAAQVDRAERNPRHQMALVFRWYLGVSSRWATAGESARQTDYQIWCGPAMGGFNAWTHGGFMAEPGQRSVDQVARNLLEGAAVITRGQQLRSYGVAVPDSAFTFAPRLLDLFTGVTNAQANRGYRGGCDPARRPRCQPGLADDPRRPRRDQGRAAGPLADRGLLRPRSRRPRPDLRAARRVRAGNRLRPGRLRDRAQRDCGHRYHAAAGASGCRSGAAGLLDAGGQRPGQRDPWRHRLPGAGRPDGGPGGPAAMAGRHAPGRRSRGHCPGVLRPDRRAVRAMAGEHIPRTAAERHRRPRRQPVRPARH